MRAPGGFVRQRRRSCGAASDLRLPGQRCRARAGSPGCGVAPGSALCGSRPAVCVSESNWLLLRKNQARGLLFSEAKQKSCS